MKTLTKTQMAEKLGYEYLGKGIDSSGNDGFIVRKIGTTEFKSIGETQDSAQDWLMEKIKDLEHIEI